MLLPAGLHLPLEESSVVASLRRAIASNTAHLSTRPQQHAIISLYFAQKTGRFLPKLHAFSRKVLMFLPTAASKEQVLQKKSYLCPHKAL
jgi:hypothetical protein